MLEVKAAPVWRSTDRHLLGYFPGIFGVLKQSPNYTYLLPAMPGIDAFLGVDESMLYATPEECIAAWEQAAPVVLTASGVASALSEEMVERINEKTLWRDPRRSPAVDGMEES